ncbi:hypothetical protein [Actinomadura miaoliensis]|uniref:Uncharacterized protein n=1 Tax=Actinomadura miaoliensis TaxID=430685 RepID=A0ABP7V5P9_9ACTN
MSSSRIITCACCGKTGRHGGHGYRDACYQRWVTAGRPDTGLPPPKPPRGRRPGSPGRARLERMADFAMVRRTRTTPDGDPISIAQAAAAVGVSARTGQRYANALKNRKNPR